ncbi:dsRBD fold-containing protein [Amycolatopsis sp. CA-230715]|uniref:dsRBD fold-containing protein n=1 Tax=Amycolatopsis sp. CA-230715 TaxID=2745196 RepID=UPI001C32A23A|nr:dsRBD fold-containing protein [Amycolatopsis sp. CA-230715]QWF83993.1 hypothetical protein HUW46_07437 [Amycolatopsis sp. CA-230715]
MNAENGRWMLSIAFEHGAYRTRARAILTTGDATGFTGIGLASRGSAEYETPHVADYLAVARALSDLTAELLEAVAADIDATTAGLLALSVSGTRPHLTGADHVN